MQSLSKSSNSKISDHFIKIGEEFKLNAKKQLGYGAFGEIYEGENLNTKEKVAIKLEPLTSKNPQLQQEAKIYGILQGGIGIPSIYFNKPQGKYNVLVMDYLGLNLEDLLIKCQRHFSLKTICLIGLQMISRIEYIHSKNFIHRDIKPDNFLIGVGNNKNIIYIIDFGLSKRFRDPKTGLHIPYRDGKNLTGTARYASINTHLGLEQSRRDDIESMIYVLIYLFNGELPWQGIPAKDNKEKYEKIKQKKIKTPVESLCEGLPKEIQEIVHYSRNLRFDDRPNYESIRKIFNLILQKEGLTQDEPFDWDANQNRGINNLLIISNENENNRIEKK